MNKHLFSPLPALSVLIFALIVVSQPAAAHHVSHEVTRGDAVVVSLAYGNGSPLAHDRYEIIAEGEEAPYQSGNTDAGGRIVFLPDRSSVWRVRVFSEDGHGADFTFKAGPTEAAIARPEAGEPADEVTAPLKSPPVPAEPVAKPFVERFAGPVAGVGIIFGIFGLFALFIRRRR